MKISFIIPIFNVKPFLEKCINSIIDINSDNYDLEIILVNDGSTDGSEKIVKHYAEIDSRVIAINKTNGGLSEARNSGLQASSGDYIWFVDGDDRVYNNALQIIYKYLADGYDIVFFNLTRDYGDKLKESHIFNEDSIIFTGNKKNQLVRRLIGPIGKEMKYPQRIEDLNPACTKIYKRKLIEKLKFTDTKKIGTEDLWFNIQAFNNADKILYINQSLYYYNKENNHSITRSYNPYLFDRWKKLYSYIDDFIHENKFNSKYDNALKNREIINLLALTRNVALSNLSKKEKYKELNRILSDQTYSNAFKSFNYDNLTLVWRLFYKSCENHNCNNILLFFKVAEKIRKLI